MSHRLEDDELRVKLTAPWGNNPTCSFKSSNRPQKSSILPPDDASVGADMVAFMHERNETHKTYIIEESKTKRLTLLVGASLFLSACLVLVFAPDNREGLSHVVGAAMLVVAAGVSGYKRVWAKSRHMMFGADSETRD